MVAQMHFAAHRLDGQRRIGEKRVRSMHAALDGDFLFCCTAMLLSLSFH
jgi:hypothetical protein